MNAKAARSLTFEVLFDQGMFHAVGWDRAIKSG